MTTESLAPIPVAFVMHRMQVAGAEVLVAEIIRRLGRRIDPTVLCLDGVGPIGERLIADGVPVIDLKRKPGRDYGVALRISRALRQRDARVVHAHQYSPFFYAALAKVWSLWRFRLILTEHGRHYPDLVSPVRRAVNRLLLDRCADAVNACVGFSARALSRVDGFAGARIAVIENGIEIERYAARPDRAELRRSVGLDPARRYVAAVARFHPVKDHATLIRGFAGVARAVPDVDLLLVGDGPLRDELQTQVADAGLGGRVLFWGVRADVPNILACVDVFALTSLSEAASLTVMEAMASGLPSVVTDVGGNPDLVRSGVDGILVPRGDSAAVSVALLELLRDPAKAEAMGRSARQRAVENFQLARTVSQYWDLYSRLAGRGTSTR